MIKQSICDVRWRLLEFLSHLLLIIRRLALRHASWVVCELLETGPKPFWFSKEEELLSKTQQARQASKQSEWQGQVARRRI